MHVSVFVHVYACMCSQRLMCMCDCLGGTYGGWRIGVFVCYHMFMHMEARY